MFSAARGSTGSGGGECTFTDRSRWACFFAGTVLILFAAAMPSRPQTGPRYGLSTARSGAGVGGRHRRIAMLPVALDTPHLLSIGCAHVGFLLGMGIVNPWGTAHALSPFGDKRALLPLVASADDDGRHRRPGSRDESRTQLFLAWYGV